MKPSLHQPFFFFFILATFLSLFLTVHSKPSSSHHDSDFIRTSCNATSYPDICFSSLSSFSASVHNDPARLARAAISVSLSKTLHLASYLSNFTLNESHPTAAAVFHDCFEYLKDAVDEMRGSMKQMKELVSTGSVESFTFQMSNVQTWLSTALTYEEICTDEFEGIQDEPRKEEVVARVEDEPRKEEVVARVDDVKKFTSNALALVNRFVDKAIH